MMNWRSNMWEEVFIFSPNPPPPPPFYLHPNFLICKYILHNIYIPEYHIIYFFLKINSIIYEKKNYILVWGEALRPSPNSPLPFFYIKTQVHKYISWDWYDNMVNMVV